MRQVASPHVVTNAIPSPQPLLPGQSPQGAVPECSPRWSSKGWEAWSFCCFPGSFDGLSLDPWLAHGVVVGYLPNTVEVARLELMGPVIVWLSFLPVREMVSMAAIGVAILLHMSHGVAQPFHPTVLVASVGGGTTRGRHGVLGRGFRRASCVAAPLLRRLTLQAHV